MLAETHKIYHQNFVSVVCTVIAHKQNLIAETVVRDAGYAGEYTAGKRTLTKEPLAMVTRKDDPNWSIIPRSIIYDLSIRKCEYGWLQCNCNRMKRMILSIEYGRPQ